MTQMNRPDDTIADELSALSDTPPATELSLLDRLMRGGVWRQLERLRHLSLILTDTSAGGPGLTRRFGAASDGTDDAQMTVAAPGFYRRSALGGSIGFAESYILGEWTTDNLAAVLRVFCRNMAVADSANSGLVRLLRSAARRWHERRSNSRHNSLRNIHAHYDLGNEFYALFLDETMTYSSGVFEGADTTLREAQIAKIDRLCRKLDLKPEHHLIEIGTGWGALAIHAAQQYGCRVTTTTISNEQFEFASRRVAEAGLTDRITLLRQDYRDLQGQYDRLVSVEMIEAVGREYFDTFFQKCCSLLKPDGMMTLQGITMSEQRYGQYLKSVDFIQRYIFPGGCLITPGAVLQSVARVTDLRLLHLEDLAPHYARTLRLWRERFVARIDDVRRLGFPETFIRLWEYYLCYCEAAFTERLVGTVQMQFARPRCMVDGLKPFL